jgi:hypothetical protein
MKAGTPHNSGAFAALNPATGAIIRQVKAPVRASGMDWGMGPLAVANGVVFGASFFGQMTALEINDRRVERILRFSADFIF